MKLNRGKGPVGGWHFEVAPGVRLEAITGEDLTKLIFEYRLRNNIPIGDIERDIDDYYCSRWPKSCHKEPKDYLEGSGGESPPAEPPLNRVTRWAALMTHQQPKGGYSLVSSDEADRRAKICAECPNNQPWRVGCTGCNTSTTAVLSQLRKLQSSKHQGNLMACKTCGWDNGTAVWMPSSALGITENQSQSLPEKCWRKA